MRLFRSDREEVVDKDLKVKFDNLIYILKESQSALLAYSGGVDSTFLLNAMKLSGMRFIAVTSVSETTPEVDIETAREMAGLLSVEHIIIKGTEMNDPRFIRNDRNRCFYCKSSLFMELERIRSECGLRWIMDGSNINDLSDYRPGLRAREIYNVRSPLIEASINKNEVRRLSSSLGLKTSWMPSSPCLSSRIPYGERITVEKLRRIRNSEDLLRREGFNVVRVRDFGNMAVIEVSTDEIHRLINPELKMKIINGFKAQGYRRICIDIEGYRTGSLNTSLMED